MTSPPDPDPGLERFNQSTPAQARELLSACLAVPRWVEAVLAGRPYPGTEELLTAATAALPLLPEEVGAAIAAHPRIGERSGSSWSTAEQSGVDSAAAERFAAANREYEQRFGHVYLVCASGRDGAELLADLRSRMDNDPVTELGVAGAELGKIALLRLRKAVSEPERVG